MHALNSDIWGVPRQGDVMQISFSFDKKRLLIAAALIAATIVGSALVPGTPMRFALAACLLFAAAACLRLSVRGWYAVLTMALFTGGAALMTVLLCQMVNDLRGAPHSAYLIFLGCACFMLAAVVLHLVLLCVSRVSIRPAVVLVTPVLLILAVANRFTYEYRGTAMTPVDLLGAQTAFNILDSYRIAIDKNIWYAIVFFALELFAAASIHVERFPKISARRIVTLLAAVVLGVFVHSSLGQITPAYWGNGGVLWYGFVVNFSRELRDSFVTRPEGYGAARIRTLEQRYEASEAEPLPDKLPHVIVVMNESLADFRVFGEMTTDEPVTPFMDSLQENTVRGFALSSVYGGKTPNSEFEFLTGNSMAFLSPSMIAFTMIQRPTYTLERYLESLGYDSYATHPEEGTNWKRSSVYPLLGFSDFSFHEQYLQADTINGWVTDEAVYDNIIQEFKTANTDAPRFLYAVTAQNHGAYGLEDEGLNPIGIAGYESVSMSAYLARVRESDRAFEKLVSFFDTVDEPVVILMYGDHHPNEEPDMIEYLHGGPLESLDEQQLMYEIPFLIWANYDIEEQRPPVTSINFLSNYLLEAAGLPLPPYHRFLHSLQQTIPALNTFGYYSLTEGCFLPLAEARGAEQQALAEYESLQYNALHDKRGRSEFFFPAE